MSRRFTRCACAVVAVSLVAGVGCIEPSYNHAQLIAESAADEPVVDRSFRPSDRLLSGFDPPRPTDLAADQWRIGDRVLFGIQVIHGETRLTRFAVIEVRSGILAPDSTVQIETPTSRPINTSQSSAGEPDPASRSADDGQALRVPPLPMQSPSQPMSQTPADWSIKLPYTLPDNTTGTFEYDSLSILLSIQVYDERGDPLAGSYVTGPESYLKHGFYNAARLIIEEFGGMAASQPASRPASQREDRHALGLRVASTIPPLWGMGRMFGAAGSLKEILNAAKPTVPLLTRLRIGLAGSIDFGVTVNWTDIAPETRHFDVDSVQDALQFPILIEVQDEPLMRCILSVIDPAPPFHLCAGVIAADGVDLHDTEHRFVLRLLAARRGPKP